MKTEEDVLNWIAELFQHPVVRLKPETPREDIPDWDSLGVLSLMAGLDEQYGILLSDAELNAMTRVGDILNVLRRVGKLPKTPPL